MPKRSTSKRRQLQSLADKADHEIDVSDIAEITKLSANAIVGKFYRPKKTSVTIRLDADVLAWLKATGEGYQTRINDYLRQLMMWRRRSSDRSET